MAKDTDYTGGIDEMPYDEYVAQQKAAREADAQAQKQKADGDSVPKQFSVDQEGGYQPESFSEEGGYDDYLASSSASSLSGDDKGKKQTRNGEDSGTTEKHASSSTGEAEINVLAGGQGSGTEMASATASQAAAGIGSKIVDGVKNAGANVLNGVTNMFRSMGGTMGQMAQTLHVSVKAIYVAMALLSGTGVTLFGITFFGDDNLGRFEPQRDCRVSATMEFQYTNNEIYNTVTQSAMDGTAKSIYKALTSKDLIDGIIGFEYTVGDEDTDPYYDERTRFYVEPVDAEHPEHFKYLGIEEMKNGETDADGNPRLHETWMFDVNMGKQMWSHGPATLLDTVPGTLTGVLNVIPGNGARVTGEDPDVSNRIGAGTLPGLTDQRIQPHLGFTDEAVLGMILNAETESSLNPGCWEADYLCYWYIDMADPNSRNPNRNVVLATTHHRNWNSYVLELVNVYGAGGTTIDLDTYHYTDINGQDEELDGQRLYYPGIGLWQWTGARAYAMEQWNNMLMNVRDGTLDTANDTLYTLTSQIYYVLFENLGDWRGNLNHPADIAGFDRYALNADGTRIEETRPDPVNDPMSRVSLIDWGITPRVTYTETYYVNIQNRPNTEDLYGRERLAIHTFDSVRTLNQGDDTIEDNHNNLVRPQFDYVYTDANGETLDYGGITVKDVTAESVRKVNMEKVCELYELMITHPDRPACTCCECIGCVHGDDTWAKFEADSKHDNPECDHDPVLTCTTDEHTHSNDCDEDVLVCEEEHEHTDDCYEKQQTCGKDAHTHGDSCYSAHEEHKCDHNGEHNGDMDDCPYGGDCSPDPCYHQCQLDTITDVREMINVLMETYKTKDGDIWWEGLEEADFLDVGEHSTTQYSCGDKLYNNLHGNIPGHTPSAHNPEKLNSSNNLSVYYVKWYYDVSVEVAAYQGGALMHDVDNMSSTSGGINGERNGNADRPDVTSYANSGKTAATEAGDQIIYESTPEAVCGYVAGEEVYEDTHAHPGTNTDDDGYSQQSHASGQGGWMRGTAGTTNWQVHFYMQRTIGSPNSTQWSNYGDYPATWSGTIAPVDARLDYDTDWIGWNQEVFEAWWGQLDTTTGVHGCKIGYAPLSGRELTDRYYRLRLAAYSGDIISPATGAEAVFGEDDGNLAQGGGLRAEWVGTGSMAYPKQPVEPTVDDLSGGGGGGVIGGVTDWDTGSAFGGGDDYIFVRTISDNLMWWAEARAIGQAARVSAREFTAIWEGMPIDTFLNNHSKFGSAVHYAFKMLSDTWGSDNKGASSILDLWYENMSTAPVQTWWQSFYRNYCNTGDVSFGGIAECAVSWAWLQGHESTATINDTGPRLAGGQYMKTLCTELYVGVKDLMETIPTTEPMPGLYSSCDRGVCTAVHAAGADDEFPWGAAVTQYQYALASGKWEDLGVVSAGSFDSLEPGDLLLSPHHVIVFVGGEYAAEKWPSEVSEATGKYGVVHSSLSAHIDNSRGPRYDPDGRSCVSSGDFHAFRLVGEPDANSACRAALEANESSLSGLDDGSF